MSREAMNAMGLLGLNQLMLIYCGTYYYSVAVSSRAQVKNLIVLEMIQVRRLHRCCDSVQIQATIQLCIIAPLVKIGQVLLEIKSLSLCLLPFAKKLLSQV